LDRASAWKAYSTAVVGGPMIVSTLKRPPRLGRHGCKASILAGKPKACAGFVSSGGAGKTKA
jgi:hypothetical protein